MRTLCLGEALVDLICRKPVASIAEADAFVPSFGGATANVAVVAARHGAEVDLAGGAGDDPWGEWLRAALEREGVGLDYFSLVGGARTPIAFVTVDADGEPAFQIYGDAIETLVTSLGDRLDEAVERGGALFVASNTLVGERERELTMAARARALDLGRPVVFDPNFRLHRWASPTRAADASREFVRGAFLVKCNAEEARLLTGERDPEAAADGLLAGGARHVVVTLGAGGALLRGGRMRLDVPAPAVTPLDTTGAGDVLMGVLLAGLAATDYYPSAIAAALPDAVDAAARATERWGAVG